MHLKELHEREQEKDSGADPSGWKHLVSQKCPSIPASLAMIARYRARSSHACSALTSGGPVPGGKSPKSSSSTYHSGWFLAHRTETTSALRKFIWSCKAAGDATKAWLSIPCRQQRFLAGLDDERHPTLKLNLAQA